MFYEEEDLYAEKETARKKIKARRLFRFLLPYFLKYRGGIILGGFLLLGSTILSLIGPLILRQAIDGAIKNSDLGELFRLGLFYLVLSIFIFLLTYYQQVLLASVGERAIADVKKTLFSHILNLPLTFFDKNQTGKILTRIESDSESLKMLFTVTGGTILTDLVMLLGMSVIMIKINYQLYLLVFLLFPPFSYAFYWFQKQVRPVYVDIRKKVSEINNFINEHLNALSVVQAFNREGYVAEKCNRLSQEKYEKEVKGMGLWYRVWFLIDFGEVLALVLILSFGSLWALKGKITIGTLFLFFSYIQRVFFPLRGLSDQLNVIQRALASAERIYEIFSLPKEEKGEEVGEEKIATFSYPIVFREVNFSYEGENLVLADINLEIKSGEKVALVGETGGGKTSLISLLLRFYEPKSGKIYLGPYERKDLPIRIWRRFFGFVPQDIILFPGSILDNLRLFDSKISEEKVMMATKRLKIHERILSFPEGYETNLLERGINLSVGERQLLSFARALIFNPPILILDEATSSVDPQTEQTLQEGLQEILRGRTAIIIAHRLATIQMCDRVIVIHKGRVREVGSHKELLEKGGIYSKLYQLQFVGKGDETGE
jgi:ABC-type multidrug transport system fused ATPase/permease subunit